MTQIFLTLLPAFLLLAFPAWGQSVETAWRVETVEKRFAIEPDVALELVNTFGEFLIQGVDATSEVVVHGVIQHHVDDPRRPRLVVSEGSDGFRLEVSYPKDRHPKDRHPPPDAWRKRRIDVTVQVPWALPLHVETLHGRLRVRDIQAPIEAIAESGDIEIRSSGMVKARSHHGQISLRVLGESVAPLALETVTGEIRVDVPWGAIFQASLETRGEIASDFSTHITWLADSHIKRGSVSVQPVSVQPVSVQPVSVQPEGLTIQLRSNRGNLRLLRQMQH